MREKHTVNLGSIKVFVLQSLDAAPTSDNELFAITVMSTQLCERAKTAEERYEGMCEYYIENTEERENRYII